MSREQFLVITQQEDEHVGHVPFVAEHMEGYKLVVIDPNPGVIAGRGLSYAIDNKGTRCNYDGVALDNVASVWDRRPRVADSGMLASIDPNYRKYAASAIRRLTSQIYVQFTDALWVSDFYAVRRAEHKSSQLATATKLGFEIPETVMTSDPATAEQFVASHPATIIKPLGIEGPVVDQTLLMFFSTRVTPDTNLDYSNLRFGPAIFQRAIEPDYDLRITVVGDRVFPAAIVADIEKELAIGARDWRLGYHAGSLSIDACDIPRDVEAKCAQLVRTKGLRFGAIDMIVDKKGKHWFIEINPNGQWAFIEEETEQPIGKAMAQLLLSGKDR